MVTVFAGSHVVTLSWWMVGLGVMLPAIISALGQWMASAKPPVRRRLAQVAVVVTTGIVIVWDCGSWWGGCWIF